MDNLIGAIVPIIIAVFGSSGFWAYISAKTSKHDEILNSVKCLEKTLVCVSEKVNDIERINAEVEAKNIRNRIVRFADEIRVDVKHSKDMFDQIMIDCDSYEHYCATHEGFKNSIAEVSIKKIKDNYEKENFL